LRSIDRAQELGEVFTHKREVDAMLDLIPETFQEIETTFLEPACGDGNFLVEIFARKIKLVQATSISKEQADVEFEILHALSSIYGVDISELNVNEAISRLVEMSIAAHAFMGLQPSEDFVQAARAIAETNVVLGDALNSASEIVFVEYAPTKKHTFKRTPFHLEPPEIDLFYVPPVELPEILYSQLGVEK